MKQILSFTFFLALVTLPLHAAQIPSTEQADQISPETIVAPVISSARNEDQQKKVQNLLRQLPLSFEENRGQTDPKVKFLSRGNGFSLFLTSDEAVLALKQGAGDRGSGTKEREKTRGAEDATLKPPVVLRMELIGANPKARISGMEALPGKSNYFIGNDPEKWHQDIPNYAKVRYQNVYPGVDLVYYGNQRQLEYDFVVSPGANPKAIQIGFQGIDRLEIDTKGDLILQTQGGEVRMHEPRIYQESNGAREAIPGHYVLKGKNKVGFQVAFYDTKRPLIIDPILSYSTFLGGSGGDSGSSIAVDASGSVYITGDTNSINFPITAGSFQPASGGGTCDNLPCRDAFVTKINSAGTALIYSTYLGGNNSDAGAGIVVDASGNAYLTGITLSTNFPTTAGSLQTTLSSGNCGTADAPRPCSDAFVVKVNATGSNITYSTYLGGSREESGRSIALDSSGNAYITGNTDSTNFPTTAGAFQTTLIGNCGTPDAPRPCSDAFITKINITGTALIFSGFLGGSNVDRANGIAVDTSGNAYIIGDTGSSDFPTTTGAFQTTLKLSDAFITKINATGTALIYSTFFGGTDTEVGSSIAVDATNHAYVTGSTRSTDLPTSAGAFQPSFGGDDCGTPQLPRTCSDVFAAKVNATGSDFVYSTYLGGNNVDTAHAIAVDANGNTYIVGNTSSLNFPVVNPIQPTFGGGFTDVFVTKLNPTGSALMIV